MANHVRQQIREAIATAVTGLTTTGSNVFQSRIYPLQSAELPALRVFTNSETVAIGSMGASRIVERVLEVVIEAVVKATTDFDDTVDGIVKQVEIALASAQGAGGAKYVQLVKIEIEMDGEGDQPVAMARMSFEVPYNTALGAPDVAL